MLWRVLLFISLTSNLFTEISREELLGKINPKKHPDFVEFESYGRVFWIRKEVALRLKEMINEARKCDVELRIVSAFRSYSTQKYIWERKVNSFSKKMGKKNIIKEVLNYSAMPGTSRHHWGTDIDFVSVNPSFFDTPHGIKIFLWLSNNAPKFGFFMPYSPDRKNKNGYKDEKWHWSYKPIATKFLSSYTNLVSYKDLSDFSGCEFAEELNIFSDYVLNISE